MPHESSDEESSEVGHAAHEGVGHFPFIALVFQVAVIATFYTAEFDGASKEALKGNQYNFYVGVALMMFVGFGYLMTFLKAYGLGAVGFTMMITCLGVEMSLIFESYIAKGSLELTFECLLNANFAVAALLISFGALIGKLSPTQIVVLIPIELLFYTLNKVYVMQQYEAWPFPPVTDVGGSMQIHAFGAYFGLACAKVIGPPRSEKLKTASYVSDIFSLVGTVFLWLFWPSFVSSPLEDGPLQTTALMNTVLALLSSTVVTFGLTPLLQADKKLAPVPIQNATLAGGVAVGTTAHILGPFGAMVVGAIAGAVSTFGFVKEPLLADVDTCGIHNLHGMPGVLGGLVSIAFPLMYARKEVVMLNQFLGLLGTLSVAIGGGAATGFVLKMLGTPKESFNDEVFWECAEDIPSKERPKSIM